MSKICDECWDRSVEKEEASIGGGRGNAVSKNAKSHVLAHVQSERKHSRSVQDRGTKPAKEAVNTLNDDFFTFHPDDFAAASMFPSRAESRNLFVHALQDMGGVKKAQVKTDLGVAGAAKVEVDVRPEDRKHCLQANGTVMSGRNQKIVMEFRKAKEGEGDAAVLQSCYPKECYPEEE
jgi:hypothetical protein